MSVSFHLQLPHPDDRDELRAALEPLFRTLRGDWYVSIVEPQNSADWHLRIEGSTGHVWSRAFSGPEEQTADFIRRAVEKSLSLSAPALIRSIVITGFGPFARTTLPLGRLQVLVGANGSGKTSFFEFLRAIREFVRTEIPPAIIAGWETRDVFHRPGPDQIGWDIVVANEDRRYNFEARISGPAGSPTVMSERIEVAEGNGSVVAILERAGNHGAMTDLRTPTLARLTDQRPNQLALRRYVNPSVPLFQSLGEIIDSWRFFSGIRFNDQQLRQPALIEEAPTLREDGGNLAAVVHWLQTEHSSIFHELETHVAGVVPAFRRLFARASGAGRVTLNWDEDGLVNPLTAADLSDGSLRLLLWVTLALVPNPPTLVCIDEPEAGLHPRTLPKIAALLRKLSDRTQVIMATHSSYLLAQFDVREIGILQKTKGSITMQKPADSQALLANLQEFGSEEIELMHRSDELEALS